MVNFTKKIKNSDKFRQPALTFIKTGSYCNYPKGTTEYYTYWETEMDRCTNGYTAADGDYITGYNYFYLNYCPIQRIVYSKTLNINGEEIIKKERKQAFPDFWDYDWYFFQLVEEAEHAGKHLIVTKSRRKGYEQPYSELVATPTGFVTMGSIQVGDEVLTPYGTTTKVLEVYEQGYKDLYEVVLHDGRRVRCGKDHLWQVYTAHDASPKVMTTWDLIQAGLSNVYRKWNVCKYYLAPISPVPYTEQQLLIDPYVLGCLLGSGLMYKPTSMRVSITDPAVLAEFQRVLGEDYELHEDHTHRNYRVTYKRRFDKSVYEQFVNGRRGVNPLYRYIDEFGLLVTREHRFIPAAYLYSSIEQRLELVKGLIDTAGSINSNGGIEFIDTSKRLVNDLALVLRSLGINCSIDTYQSNDRKLLHRLHIKSTLPLFKANKQFENVTLSKLSQLKTAIVEINKLDYQEQCKCILVDDERHMYLTRDYIPTHNSYKTASMMCRNFFLLPNSKSYVYASNSQYLTEDGNLTKAWDYMDFIDENTAWGKKRQVANTALRRRASMLVTDQFGNKIEVGYKSEIMGVTVKDSPNKVRGKAAKLIIWEEGGSFKELKATWEIARPSVEQDGVAFGLMILFGTGGDEGDNAAGLREAFYNPEAFNCISLPNIWDEGISDKPCGFFVPQHTNLDVRNDKGERIYMDNDGNTLHNKAKEFVLALREKELKDAKDTQQVDRYIAEHAETPMEAFAELSGNIFPKKELQKQLSTIRTNKKLANFKQVGSLTEGKDHVITWNIAKTPNDITEYPLPKQSDPTGAVVIWEHPAIDAPYGLYIAGVDPYDQNQSGTNSLGSCIIYKRFQDFESYSDMIVAEYTGRPRTAEDFYETVRKLLIYYNARAMVENQNTGIFAYFNNHHCSYLLADQPDILRDITNSTKVNRGKGCHMTKEIKLWGEGMIKEWLEEDVGNNKLRLNSILSEPLLEELIKYNNKANADRVMALLQVMIYKEQLYNTQVKKKEDTEKKMTLFKSPLFKRSNESFFEPMPLDNTPTFMFTN